jgi:N6-L-threonylcarbamoyladenine synthase
MGKKKFILGIESSCDDTGASVINENGEILSNILITQILQHASYSGVVPEIAARSHLQNISFIVEEALKKANITINDIDYIGATGGPGLIGGVLVGTVYAKALASSLSIPYYAINHLEGHILSVLLCHKISFPYICLLVSGGHCLFISVAGIGDYKIIGTTIDDAPGEAFDKFAKMLGLEYPGGPIIEKNAKSGDENKYKFAKPIIYDKTANMSFSGLKTSARNFIINNPDLTINDINDLSASFQKTISDIFCIKAKNAINIFEKTHKSDRFVIVGGVASNIYLRNQLKNSIAQKNYNLYAPTIDLCTDNAAMIAYATLMRIKNGVKPTNLSFCPRSRWSIEHSQDLSIKTTPKLDINPIF